MKNRSSYLKWGLTAFLTVCAILVFYDTFYMKGTLQNYCTRLLDILSPVLMGLAMAYLLAPVVNWFEWLIRRALSNYRKQDRRKLPHAAAWLRAASILLTWSIVLLLLYLLMSVLVPQLVDSVVMLVENAEGYYNTVYGWVDGLLKENPQLEQWLQNSLAASYQSLVDLLTNRVLPGAQQMLTAVTGGIWSVVSFALDFLVGIIVSVYMLAMKEQSLARCCKLLYGLLREDRARWIARATRRVDAIFSGFVRGKILDSIIIGILCFIGCSLLRLPYVPLVSLIVGVTNVIPFFGPFLGAIPSAFLILLVSPKQCLIFVIFVFALQQFDGNILGPKILGNATGISSFWVVVAILVGGGFFGVVGMFLGVPVFACLRTLVKYLVDRRLTRRNMPTEAYRYVDRDWEE